MEGKKATRVYFPRPDLHSRFRDWKWQPSGPKPASLTSRQLQHSHCWPNLPCDALMPL